jgi:protein TonB
MEWYNITYKRPRQGPVWAEPGPLSWALSGAAHVVVLLVVLWFVRVPAPATPQEAPVDMVFQPPAAAATAPRPPAADPDETPLPDPAPPPAAPSPPPVPAAEPPAAQAPPTVFAPPPSPARPTPRHAPSPPPQTARPATVSPTVAPPAQASGPPTPAAESAPPAPRAAPIDGIWMQALGSWLAAHKTYPDEARSLGEEGRLAVRFTVDRAGRVSGVEIVRSSGSPRLDDAARHMLQGATLPSLPATMTQDSVTVTVQIRYALSP